MTKMNAWKYILNVWRWIESLKLFRRIRGRKYRFTENRPFAEKSYARKIQKLKIEKFCNLNICQIAKKRNLGKDSNQNSAMVGSINRKSAWVVKNVFVVDSFLLTHLSRLLKKSSSGIVRTWGPARFPLLPGAMLDLCSSIRPPWLRISPSKKSSSGNCSV